MKKCLFIFCSILIIKMVFFLTISNAQQYEIDTDRPGGDYINFNLDNPNPKAVEIANKELATICRAVGLVSVEDSDELHGLPMECKAAIESGGDYPDKNVIKNYSAAEGYSKPPAKNNSGNDGEAPKKKKGPVFE